MPIEPEGKLTGRPEEGKPIGRPEEPSIIHYLMKECGISPKMIGVIETAAYNVVMDVRSSSIWGLYYPGAEKRILIKPATSYEGPLKKIGIHFGPPEGPLTWVGALSKWPMRAVGDITADGEPISDHLEIKVYAPIEWFGDVYHVLQTETPCYFHFATSEKSADLLSWWQLNSTDEPRFRGDPEFLFL